MTTDEPAGPGFVSLDRFVAARLDGEEAIALACDEERDPGIWYSADAAAYAFADSDGEDPPLPRHDADGRHIERQSPAHVLALVAAHRRILDRYRQVQPFTVHHAGIGIGLKAVAGIWSDHPDYAPRGRCDPRLPRAPARAAAGRRPRAGAAGRGHASGRGLLVALPRPLVTARRAAAEPVRPVAGCDRTSHLRRRSGGGVTARRCSSRSVRGCGLLPRGRACPEPPGRVSPRKTQHRGPPVHPEQSAFLSPTGGMFASGGVLHAF